VHEPDAGPVRAGPRRLIEQLGAGRPGPGERGADVIGRIGDVMHRLAAILQEEAFEHLDAPVRIVGALDTPVPYSPPLEEFFLPSEEEVERAARLLAAF